MTNVFSIYDRSTPYPEWTNRRVAFYDKCIDNIPAQHPEISEVLHWILNGLHKDRETITAIRRRLTRVNADKVNAKKLNTVDKTTLSCVTFGCNAQTRSGDVAADRRGIESTGICCLDFDEVSNLGETKKALCNDPFVGCVFISPSGNGLKVLVLFSDPSRFKDCWKTAAAYFLDVHQLKADPARSDLAGLCFISWDREIYLNSEEPEKFHPMEAVPAVSPAVVAMSAHDLRPGDDFCARGSFPQLLQAYGWTMLRDGDNQLWTRPGKIGGTSATLKDRVFYVFSSSTPFEPSKGYSLFQAYAILKHDGDYRAAAADLGRQGYGSQQHGVVDRADASVGQQTTASVPPKLKIEWFKDTIEEAPEWIWPGYIPKKSTVVIGGKQGGKKGSHPLRYHRQAFDR